MLKNHSAFESSSDSYTESTPFTNKTNEGYEALGDQVATIRRAGTAIHRYYMDAKLLVSFTALFCYNPIGYFFFLTDFSGFNGQTTPS
jgi:hypothetical protein